MQVHGGATNPPCFAATVDTETHASQPAVKFHVWKAVRRTAARRPDNSFSLSGNFAERSLFSANVTFGCAQRGKTRVSTTMRAQKPFTRVWQVLNLQSANEMMTKRAESAYQLDQTANEIGSHSEDNLDQGCIPGLCVLTW